VSGREQGPAPSLMTSTQASRLLDHVVHERIRELFDFCGLLHFEQELWGALVDCGVPREHIPTISADMIARAFERIGESRKQLAAARECKERLPTSPD
jgi:hypothetical protein